MWVIVRRVAQTIVMATTIRARLDDKIGFNLDDLIRTESMLPEEQRTVVRYQRPGKQLSSGVRRTFPPAALR
jgi:hypothetical protein